MLGAGTGYMQTIRWRSRVPWGICPSWEPLRRARHHSADAEHQSKGIVMLWLSGLCSLFCSTSLKLADNQSLCNRGTLVRLMVKLSTKFCQLPKELFLTGVTRSTTDYLASGSYGDIFLGEFQQQQVALKRLRVYQMIDESKKEKMKKVSTLLSQRSSNSTFKSEGFPLRGSHLAQLESSTHPPLSWNRRHFI